MGGAAVDYGDLNAADEVCDWNWADEASCEHDVIVWHRQQVGLAELAEAYMAGIGPAPCRAVAAEDIRDLQRWTRHASRALSGRPAFGLILLRQQRREAVERTHDLTDGVGGDAGVERRGVELGVPKQDLDHPNMFIASFGGRNERWNAARQREQRAFAIKGYAQSCSSGLLLRKLE